MSHAAHSQTNELGWNPDDPHGSSTHAHGHVVVSWKIQLAVLAALLFFTALTVGFYNLEQWAESAFDIHLPLWVNIVGAMSIACIKATLVCMFFMQLRYDKALNTFILLFCLFAVGLFLFFSMLDLSTRGWVNSFKFGEIQPGGTGYSLGAPAHDEHFDARVSPRVQTNGESIVAFRRAQGLPRFMEQHPGSTELDFWADHYHHYPQHRSSLDTHDYFAQLGYSHEQPEVSTANRSVSRHGLSGALDLADPAPAHGGASHHADGH